MTLFRYRNIVCFFLVNGVQGVSKHSCIPACIHTQQKENNKKFRETGPLWNYNRFLRTITYFNGMIGILVVANVSPFVPQPSTTRPVIAIPQPPPGATIYRPPTGSIVYQSSPVVTSGVPHARPIPMSQQGGVLPISYVVPNGGAGDPMSATTSPQPTVHLLGKGFQNDLSNILNPKVTSMPGNT